MYLQEYVVFFSITPRVALIKLVWREWLKSPRPINTAGEYTRGIERASCVLCTYGCNEIRQAFAHLGRVDHVEDNALAVEKAHSHTY